MSGPRKGTKKARYTAAFEVTIPRLAQGEVVLIGLEALDELGAYADAHTLRVYWTQWRKAQCFLADPEMARWLEGVRASFVRVRGKPMMQFVRRDTMENALLGEDKRIYTTLLLTGRGGFEPKGHSEPHVPSMEVQKLLSNVQTEAQIWMAWLGERGHDWMQHTGAIDSLKFNSPEGEAYRKRYDYRQPSASDPPQVDYLNTVEVVE